MPVVTYALIAVNALVFFYFFMLPEPELLGFVDNYALVPAFVSSGRKLLTLFTSMFMHASLGHILGNMIFLNIFGDNLEDKLGHVKYLAYYLVCGLGASFLQILVDPSSTIPNLGASGAIAGVMGGYLLLFPREPIDVLFSFGLVLREATLPAYTMLFYWFIAQLFSGFGSLALGDQMMGGVAFFAHVGGFLTGFLFLLPFKNRLLVQRSGRSRFWPA